MYPLETNRDVRKLRWQYKANSVPEKRLPVMADEAVDYGRKYQMGELE